MIDPGTATLIGSGVSAFANGLFGGSGQKAAAKEQGREFDVSTMPQLARLIQSAPLRDKLLAIMGNLAGSPPAAFKANDLFNPSGPAQAGGYSQAQLSTPAGYQDNSGSYQEMLRQALHTLGYHQFDPQNPSPAPTSAPAAPYGQNGPAQGQRPYFGAGGIPAGGYGRK